MRFSQAGWELIQQEAREQGISATEFVRTSAILYAIYLRTRRDGRNDDLESIIERLQSE